MYSYSKVGLWSLGVIHVAGASLTSFGIEASVFSVCFALVINLLQCAQYVSSGQRSCPLGSWLDQLAALCWLSSSCLVLSGYLDYYDDLQHHSYLHLVPIDVFPRVMPLVVVLIISTLFALGLEASHLLHMITLCLFWSTFALFAVTSIMEVRNNFQDFTADFETIQKSTIGASVWFSFTVGCRNEIASNQIKGILLSSTTYIATLLILSSLRGIAEGEPSLTEPLGILHSWYRLIQVPLISCCLGMVVYQLYIPTLDIVAHRSFIPRLSQDSRLTGTKLMAITLVGLYCFSLVYLYPPGKLILIGSAAALSARAIDSIHVVWTKHWASSSLISKKVEKKKRSGYRVVKVTETVSAEDEDLETGLLSSDSGHSSDPDIDEIVQEYKNNSEVLRGMGTGKPSSISGIISTISLSALTFVSLTISHEISHNRVTYIPWCFTGLLGASAIFYFLPTSPEEVRPVLKKNLCIWSIVSTTVLFGVIAPTIWVPFVFWIILGSILNLHTDLLSLLSSLRGKQPTVRHFSPRLPMPKIEIKLQAIQLRNKPI